MSLTAIASARTACPALRRRGLPPEDPGRQEQQGAVGDGSPTRPSANAAIWRTSALGRQQLRQRAQPHLAGQRGRARGRRDVWRAPLGRQAIESGPMGPEAQRWLAECASRERERPRWWVRIPQQTLVFKTQDPSELLFPGDNRRLDGNRRRRRRCRRSGRGAGCNQDNETEHHKAPNTARRRPSHNLIVQSCL